MSMISKVPVNRFLSVKDLSVFYGCCVRTAQARSKELCDYFNLKGKRPSVIHLAKYEGLTVDEVLFLLKM